jgi:hypothetical protein
MTAKFFADTAMDWPRLQQHARKLITEPVKAPCLDLMNEVRSKVITGATWTRDELYDRLLPEIDQWKRRWRNIMSYPATWRGFEAKGACRWLQEPR